MAGITRIKIVGNTGHMNEKNLALAEDYRLWADALYHTLFEECGYPLSDGAAILECAWEELAARYDYQEGIDILLNFQDGTRGTLQEKVLDWHEDTLTIENMKGYNHSPGAWFKCTAQYYAAVYPQERADPAQGLRSGIIVNLPALHIATAHGRIPWGFRGDIDAGRNQFRWVYFDDIPDDCTVARF